MSAEQRAVLIAGPTASGKSALALEKAEALDGVVVNTDSMQVYDVLSALTARPQADELAAAPHKLYGFVSPSERYSAGAWRRAVEQLILKTDGRPLIFVGGSGLYFDALLNGVALVPEVSPDIVQKIESELAGLDRDGRAALLLARDPDMAARLNEPDPQRVVRALAVLEATGKSLAQWQDGGQAGLLDDFALERIILSPDRDVLRARIAERFATMMAGSGPDEVTALLALQLDASLPAMKAIGVREISAWMAGTMTREEASERAIIATQRYAKRQRTWFRGRMADWDWI